MEASRLRDGVVMTNIGVIPTNAGVILTDAGVILSAAKDLACTKCAVCPGSPADARQILRD